MNTTEPTPEGSEGENLLVEMSVTMNNLCRFYDQKDERAMRFTMDKAYALSHKGIAHLMELDKANETISDLRAALAELISIAEEYKSIADTWRFGRRDEREVWEAKLNEIKSAIERAKKLAP